METGRDPLPLMQRIATALRSTSLRVSTEAALQEDIAARLSEDGLIVARESVLGPRDRIDFLVLNRSKVVVGVEVKIGGTFPQAARQVHRYVEYPGIDGLLLVTSKLELAKLPETISGKPVRCVYVGGFVV